MKKTLIALAALAASGLACAQSSVTLFGIVDASLSHYSVSGGASRTVLTNSGLAASQLGFRGTEDLGGGLFASFWLEAPLSNDDGNPGGLTFQRRSFVSLGGNWGELRLGRDYVPTFKNDTAFDPFGTNGIGTNVILKGRLSGTAAPFAAGIAANNPTAVRSSNSVAYLLPENLGGFTGHLMYALDEQTAAGQRTGRYVGGRVGYASGPLDVGVAHGKVEGSNPAVAATPDVTTSNIGASWDLGMAKLMGEYARERYETAAGAATGKGWLIGGLVPVGAGQIRLAYSRVTVTAGAAAPRASQLALGYVHNLSKRTALYTTYARISNSNGAMLTAGGLPGLANAASSGYDLGVRHSF